MNRLTRLRFLGMDYAVLNFLRMIAQPAMARNLVLAGLLFFLLFALGDQGGVGRSPARFVPIEPSAAPGLPAPEPATASSPSPAAVSERPAPVPVPVSVVSRRAPVALVKIKELEAAVKKYAAQHGVDEDLVWAVMRNESDFNPRAVSPKGAMGLMQLMPGTASLMGVGDPFNIEQNIAGGVKYLEYCLRKFHQDLVLALAAYNAGPQAVSKFQGCPPFPETRQYVAAVLRTYSGDPQYQRLRFNDPVGDEVTALMEKVGLHWRVPLPQWKLGEPQFHVRAPQWKQACGLP